MSILYTIVLFVTMFPYRDVKCEMTKNLIWNKQRQDFDKMHNISKFVVLQKRVESKIGRPYSFNGKTLKVSFYEEKSMVMFFDNDTKISGICGQMWYLLADYLNFTLTPVKYTERNFGIRLDNNTLSGLMGLLYRKEIDVILRAGLFQFHSDVIDYTMPVWKTNYRLVIRPEYKYDKMWMISMFTPTVWCFVFLLFLVLSIAGFILQKVSKERIKFKKTNASFSLSDHIFYTFAIMCDQGYIPDAFFNKFKLLSIAKSFFGWLVLLTFSSHLIYRMTNRVLSPPFKDVPDLLNNTDYTVLAFNGSMIYEKFLREIEASSRIIDNPVKKRFNYVNSPCELYRKVCYSQKKYAMFEIEDRYQVWNQHTCELIAVGPKYYSAMMGFALLKGVPYKSSINSGIVKLFEVGLVDALKDRWLNTRIEIPNINTFKTVDLKQVYLILLIFCCGTLLSFAVLAIENLIFFYAKCIR